jgi:hypothetical protein
MKYAAVAVRMKSTTATRMNARLPTRANEHLLKTQSVLTTGLILRTTPGKFGVQEMLLQSAKE